MSNAMRPRRYVLLDRDGTINAERNYLSRREELELLPNAVEGLRQMRLLGLGLAVVTNQSGLGRGHFDQATLKDIHDYLAQLLDDGGVILDGIYTCPHVPDLGCSCRKPETGLALQAARELDFDPVWAFVVGDKPCDVELGRRLGATTFLVRTGYGAQAEAEGNVGADYVVDDLKEAALVMATLLNNENQPMA